MRERVFANAILVELEMKMRIFGDFNQRGVANVTDLIARFNSGTDCDRRGNGGLHILINGLIAVCVADDDGLTHHRVECNGFHSAVSGGINRGCDLSRDVDAHMQSIILHCVGKNGNIGRPFFDDVARSQRRDERRFLDHDGCGLRGRLGLLCLLRLLCALRSGRRGFACRIVRLRAARGNDGNDRNGDGNDDEQGECDGERAVHLQFLLVLIHKNNSFLPLGRMNCLYCRLKNRFYTVFSKKR